MLAAVEMHKMLPGGDQWGQWSGFRLPLSEACATVWTPAGTAMHWRPATWTAENHAIAYLWPERWYVIHAFYAPAGVFAGCYCDIVTPNAVCAPDAAQIRYTDLYIDVVVRPDRSVFTKDHEVYARAMGVIPTLAEMRDRAFAELDALEGHARAWTGPFAHIAAHLARADWQTLDPASADFQTASAAQWNPLEYPLESHEAVE
jgi:protein associated with RNAse G/E